MRLCLLSSVVFLTTILFVGCANRQMMNTESGFLLKYDDLEYSKGIHNAKFYVSRDTDFFKYEYLYIKPIQILHNIKKENLTKDQKKLFKEIQNYLTKRYKYIIQGNNNYTLVNDINHKNTLIFEASISAVEIHSDDMRGMDFMPMMLVMKSISNSIKDSTVRVLCETRLSDVNTAKVLMKTLRLHKGTKVNVSEDKLTFKDVKPALDDWLDGTKNNLYKLKNSVIKNKK